MPSFKKRSHKKEMLDENNIPFAHIRQNMRELNTINTWLGGHHITLKGVRALIKNGMPAVELRIAEIGCGGGDNLSAIRSWTEKQGIKTKLLGIDINRQCIQFAQGRRRNNGIDFICADYKDVVFETKPDIVFTSLFCHHFSEGELEFMFRWMQQKSRVGFFINDLHRHPVAYYAIKMLTTLFSKSILVKNDAPLSVLRGFKKQELRTAFGSAGIKNYSVHWQWAFRWLAISYHG